MAKSNNRSVDKVERQARLANARRIERDIQDNEIRNLNRIGWQEIDFDDQDDDLEQEDQW